MQGLPLRTVVSVFPKERSRRGFCESLVSRWGVSLAGGPLSGLADLSALPASRTTVVTDWLPLRQSIDVATYATKDAHSDCETVSSPAAA